MVKTACICSECVFKWLSEYVLGKRVTIKTDSNVVVGKLIGVRYDPSKRTSRTDFMLILQNENGRVVLERWNTLSILEVN